MSKSMLALGFVLLAVGILALGCNLFGGNGDGANGHNGLPGKYVKSGSPADYLSLMADGTCYAKVEGTVFEGEWNVQGATIFLKLKTWMGGILQDGTISGNEIAFDDEGPICTGRWVKSN